MLRSLLLAALFAASAVAGTTQLPEWNTVPYRFRKLDVNATATVAINTAVNDPEWRPPYGDGESTLFRLCNAANRTARSMVFGEKWVSSADYRALWSLTDSMRDWLDKPGVPTALYAIFGKTAVIGVQNSPARGAIIAELTDITNFLEGNITPSHAGPLEDWYQSKRVYTALTTAEEVSLEKAIRDKMPEVSDVTLENYCYVRRLQGRADPKTVNEWKQISRDLLNEVSGPAAR